MKASDDPRLSAYLDEMLSGAEMMRLKQKLAQQPEAQAEMEKLRQTREVLRQLSDPTPPDDFWPQTRQRLREMASAEDKPTFKMRDKLRRLMFGAILALLAAGSLLGLATARL